MVLLIESLLHSEFTFGFELEAYGNSDIVLQKHGFNVVYDESDDEFDFENIRPYNQMSYFNDLKQEFSRWFGQQVNIVEEPTIDDENICGFEFPSPVLQLTPKNISKCIEFLDWLPNSEYKIYTTDDCGFHIHFSIPNMTVEDMIWIICNISLDDNMIEKIKSLPCDDGEINFIKYWSDDSFLYKIRQYINEHNFIMLSKTLTNEKNRIIRIHPQGTLEWRGPRNFLNKGSATIKLFFIHFYQIIQNIIDIMDRTEINGIDKNNFLRMIDKSNIIINSKYNNIKDLIEKIKQQPIILCKIGYKYNAKKITDILFNELGNKKMFNLMTDCRYRTFNNKNLLYYIIQNIPEFKKYLTTEDLEAIEHKSIRIYG